MVSKQRDRARRNRQRFEQLLNELEDQDREIADLYEDAGVEPEENDLRLGGKPTPSSFEPPARPPMPHRGFVVRG